MNEDAELGVFVPVRHLVVLQRLPIGPKLPGGVGRIHSPQNGRTGIVIFGARFLPYLIDLLRGESGGGCVGVTRLRRTGSADQQNQGNEPEPRYQGRLRNTEEKSH